MNQGMNMKPDKTLASQMEMIEAKTLRKTDNNWLNLILASASTVESQIPLVLKAIQATDAFYNDATKLSKAVQIALENAYNPPINVSIFGSVANRVAIKGSDVDVFLNLSNRIGEKDLVEFFITQKKGHNLFQTIEFISATVPIFTGITNSGLKFDISFSKPMAIYGSNLIDYYIRINDRIRQLIILLKFWLKKKDLYGGDCNRFKSHSMVLLVIFYLQKVGKPALPSVYSLQENGEKKVIDGWIVSFAESSSHASSQSSLSDLLKGFFEFYADFNFDKFIISPFLGEAIPKADFSDIKSIPVQFACLKEKLKLNASLLDDFDNVICVQDFIVHDSNVTNNITKKFLIKFKEACGEAYELFRYENKDKILFSELFKPPKVIVRIVDVLNSEGGDKYTFKNEPYEQTWKIFQIYADSANIELQTGERDKFFTLLHSLLKNVLKCECNFQNDNNIKTFRCKTDKNLLTENFKRTVLRECMILNKKNIIEVAEQISNSFCSNKKFKSGNNSAFDIIGHVKNNPSRIELHLICKEKEGHNKEFVHEIFTGLISILKKVVRIEL